MVKEELKKQGYTKEEEYFYKHNKALLEKKRKQLDEDRAKSEKEHAKNKHWMHCPKCGHAMEEVEYLRIMIDRCTDCHGIYFDKDELDILLASKEPKGFLNGLKKVFK